MSFNYGMVIQKIFKSNRHNTHPHNIFALSHACAYKDFLFFDTKFWIGPVCQLARCQLYTKPVIGGVGRGGRQVVGIGQGREGMRRPAWRLTSQLPARLHIPPACQLALPHSLFYNILGLVCKLLANGFEGPVQNFQCFQNLQTEPWNLTFRSYLLTNTHTIGFQIKLMMLESFLRHVIINVNLPSLKKFQTTSYDT